MEKYFLIFEDYRLSITQKDYLGVATEIYGNVTLKKADVDTILEPIRGTGLNLELESNSSMTFEEFINYPEQTFYVQLKKGSQTIYNGFIKPDGLQQSFVNNEWLVNVEVIDGLGAMKDLSFVKANGSQFTGKMSFYEVIKACLERTGIIMTINSFVALEYTDYDGTNILKDSYVNSSRYYKEDGNTIMDCNEVLTSILNLMSAVVTQENGYWWVYRPTDLTPNTTFINNTTDTTFVFKTDYILGSQIDNFYPHHCDANQQIEVKGAISAYRLKYEYGFLDGFIDNKDLVHDQNMVYEGWTINPSLPNKRFLFNGNSSPVVYSFIENFSLPQNIVVNQVGDLSGLIMRNHLYKIWWISKKYFTFNSIFLEVLRSNTIPVSNGNILTLQVKLKSYGFRTFFPFKIKTNTDLYLQDDGTWSVTDNYFEGVCGNFNDRNVVSESKFTFKASALPSVTSVEIIIGQPYNDSFTEIIPVSLPHEVFAQSEITYINLVDTTQTESNEKGQFLTVSRALPPSSITKENQTVFNGDSGSLLVGSIYKSDKSTLTETWNRTGIDEQKPLLLISAEDDLRVQRNPIKVFSGGIYGLFNYLSIMNINNIVGKFMFTNYSYNFRSKKLEAKLTQLYQDELNDIESSITTDYGNTTKPTIKG